MYRWERVREGEGERETGSKNIYKTTIFSFSEHKTNFWSGSTAL